MSLIFEDGEDLLPIYQGKVIDRARLDQDQNAVELMFTDGTGILVILVARGARDIQLSRQDTTPGSVKNAIFQGIALDDTEKSVVVSTSKGSIRAGNKGGAEFIDFTLRIKELQ